MKWSNIMFKIGLFLSGGQMSKASKNQKSEINLTFIRKQYHLQSYKKFKTLEMSNEGEEFYIS